MIRRGLQLIVLVGTTALGAAPCFGQAGTTNTPSYVYLQDFDDPTVNGVYNVVGTVPGTGQGTSVLHRYTGETSPVRYLSLQHGGGYNVTARIHSAYPSTFGTSLLYQLTTSSLNYPASWTGTWTGYSGRTNEVATAVFGWGAVDLYPLNFPDWASASVKIPLGFTFAMAFWAAAVALTISLKWVRDLASAAS
jgi:hypothetical protein